MCVGQDSNLRSPKATDLQSVVIDHSTTDACSSRMRRSYKITQKIFFCTSSILFVIFKKVCYYDFIKKSLAAFLF